MHTPNFAPAAVKRSCTPCQSILRTLAAAILALALVLPASALAQAPDPLSLAPVKEQTLGPIPEPLALDIVPAMQDRAFAPDQAVNYQALLDYLELTLSPDQLAYLDEHRFLLLDMPDILLDMRCGCLGPTDADNMLKAFEYLGGEEFPAYRLPANARLVTPDVMLHALHRFAENSLEYLEQTMLSDLLRRFLSTARNTALDYMRASEGELAQRYERIAAQFTVGLALLAHGMGDLGVSGGDAVPEPAQEGNDTLESGLAVLADLSGDFSPAMREMMRQELTLIHQADQAAPSPLFGQYSTLVSAHDYTRYRPRSHYTKSTLLRGYFRAMTFLGMHAYYFETEQGLGDALLVAHILSSPSEQGPALELWERLMAVTGFFAGEPDDITYAQWQPLVAEVLGDEALNPALALDQDFLARLRNKLTDLPRPRILSDVVVSPQVADMDKEGLLNQTLGLRILGQRFSMDAWILGRLTAGEEQTDTPLPTTPSALFIAAAFGDEYARQAITDFLQGTSDRFTSQEAVDAFFTALDGVARDMAAVKDREWFGSLASAWLRLLSTQTRAWDQGMPLYMLSGPFRAKQLQTFLGGYTELKHDTLLYAKQNATELGSGMLPDPPPVPMGLVEPNLAFWLELERVVEYMAQGFAEHGLLDADQEEFGALGRFRDTVHFFRGIVEKELRGEDLSEEEYERIRTECLDYMAYPLALYPTVDEEDRKVALIADIHTDVPGGKVVYEATGRPLLMLALVETQGMPRLLAGMAYNHYEFHGPFPGPRYTDQDWRFRVYEHPASLPEKNPWYAPLAVD